MSNKIDLSQPRYDQKMYWGRVRHFFDLTNPINVLATDAELDEAKAVVQAYKKDGKMPAGYNEEKLWKAKYLYESAFHPDTGEKVLKIGRMAAQAPMNTLITGGLITFYKTTASTVFWQWLNQTFNAVVNYSNRAGDAKISTGQLMTSYMAACGGALGTALTLNNVVKKNPNLNPMFAKLVPFAAVCGANMINIPMMRSSEILNGTPVSTADGKKVGDSSRAAIYGISLVVLSRIVMAVPGMTLVPLVTNYVTQSGAFCRWPRGATWFQLALLAVTLTFATPAGCALFDQRAAFPVSMLESNLQGPAKALKADTVFFNKGL